LGRKKKRPEGKKKNRRSKLALSKASDLGREAEMHPCISLHKKKTLTSGNARDYVKKHGKLKYN